MKVADVGEFGLIAAVVAAIARRQPRANWPGLVLAAGEDDTAAWRTAEGIQVATTDTLTQDVDFVVGQATWRELGWKALAVNLSDVAAMGAAPTYALVTLCLPATTEMAAVVDLYEGMLDLAEQFGVAVVGGDTGAAREISLTVAVWGLASQVEPGGEVALLQRAAARQGDVVAVTGHLGTSAAGLRMLLGGLALPAEVATLFRQAHLRPWPRVAEGQALLRAGVRAGMDVSDGLAADLEKLCRASQVGARLWVERVPIHPAVRQTFPDAALHLALAGGEDFELLFTAPAAVVERARRLTPTPITVIGEVVAAAAAGQVDLVDDRGKPFALPARGWEHFGPAQPAEG